MLQKSRRKHFFVFNHNPFKSIYYASEEKGVGNHSVCVHFLVVNWNWEERTRAAGEPGSPSSAGSLQRGRCRPLFTRACLPLLSPERRPVRLAKAGPMEPTQSQLHPGSQGPPTTPARNHQPRACPQKVWPRPGYASTGARLGGS